MKLNYKKIQEVNIKMENEDTKKENETVCLFKDLIKGDGVFELPVPHITEDGREIKEVKITEITGVEEELILKKDVVSNIGLLVTCLLDGVMKKNPLSKDPNNRRLEIRRMTTGNRDFCFLASCYLSFADDNGGITVRIACKDCEKPNKKKIIVPELKITRLGVKNGDLFTGVFPRCKKKYASRLVTGGIQEAIIKDANDNVGKSITIAMNHCIESVEGEEIDKYYFTRLASNDRTAFQKNLSDHASGVNFDFDNLELKCSHCEKPLNMRLTPMDFFTLGETG